MDNIFKEIYKMIEKLTYRYFDSRTGAITFSEIKLANIIQVLYGLLNYEYLYT